MSFLERISGLFTRSSKVDLGHPRDPVLKAWFGGDLASSGAVVTPQTVEGIEVAASCVKVLAETIATMPLHIYEITKDGERKAKEHPLYNVIHSKTNRRQTKFEWLETQVTHCSYRGAGYSYIHETKGGLVTEIMPLHPDRVFPFEAPDGKIAYQYTPKNGPKEILLDHEVLRIAGFSDDGITPRSPVQQHRETFGLSIASHEYQSKFFQNNSTPKGAIKLPGVISDDSKKALRESWEQRHMGARNANKLAILDAGMEWQQIGMTNADAEYIGILNNQVEAISRIFRVPGVLINHTDKTATYASASQFFLSFVKNTILPWVERIEQRLNRALLSESDRLKYKIGFEVKGLLRGDDEARAKFYKELFSMGALSQNDIRRFEGMTKIENGDSYYMMTNMAPIDLLPDILKRQSPEQSLKNHMKGQEE